MKLEIKNQSLFIEKAYIDGRWVDADDKSTLDVINPVSYTHLTLPTKA